MGTYKPAALTRPPPAKSSPCAMVAQLPAASPTARRQQRRDDAPCCLRQCAAPPHRAILVPGASSARIAHPVGVVRQPLAWQVKPAQSAAMSSCTRVELVEGELLHY